MKTTIGVETFESIRKRSLARARKLDRRQPVQAERRVTFEREQDFVEFLSSSRRQVLSAAMQQPRSVAELSRALKRTMSSVSHDVTALQEIGLVRIVSTANGAGQKQPKVEAIAKKIDLQSRLSA